MKIKPIPNSLYIIGSGFTRAAIPNAPINEPLLDALVKEGSKTLKKYRDIYKTDDIEKLLTLLDLESSKLPRPKGRGI